MLTLLAWVIEALNSQEIALEASQSSFASCLSVLLQWEVTQKVNHL